MEQDFEKLGAFYLGRKTPDDGGDTPADDGADAPADDDSELPPATGISIG